MGEFGLLVRKWRGRAEMTQEQLAEKSSVSVRTIRRLETGPDKNFRLDTVRLLADALNLAAEERRELMSAAGVVPPLPDSPEARSDPPGADLPLAAVADQLAEVLQGRWRREMEQRGAHNPFPLPVRWQRAPDDLADHWDNVRGVRPGGTASPLDLAGDLTEIAEVYRRVPSGRLVVLGRAGAGKTILMIRFVLDYLATRTRADPVPVIVSLGSWDPTAHALRDWVVDRLLRDHPDLAAAAPGGSTLAAALVEAGRVLPVLDGFDEIPASLHHAALLALNGTSLPMLLTSRPREYRKAVTTTNVLTWAACVWIADLTSADLSDYLRRSSRTTRWDPVLSELRDRPDNLASKNLMGVLSTPLMVSLARAVYNDTGHDPVSLLDTSRFPATDDLENHLLGSFVPAVYPAHSAALPCSDWTGDRVQRWLGYLARHLGRLGTPDLAWWQLGNSLRRSARILGVVVTSTIVTVFADWLIYLPQAITESGVTFGLRVALLDGLLGGPIVGLGFGLVYGIIVEFGGVVFAPARVQIRWFGWSGRTPAARTVLARFGAGFLGGFAVGLGQQLVATIGRGMFWGFPTPIDTLIMTTLANMLVFGVIFGLAAGLVFGLTSVLETPVDLDSATTPLAMLRTNRTIVIRRVLVLAPIFMVAIAFGGTLMVTLLQGSLGQLSWPLSYGLTVGAIGGSAGALSYIFAFTAWGQWLVFCRVWLPLTGKLPWALTTFLDDAYQRGVLRQVGAVYQFRHARLQHHLGQASGHDPSRSLGQQQRKS
ncbi:NACHT domain-containing protein [Amycolatopsis xylanica]|uniref:NACHT domain-containing protein n=1 Tax=Amycolatopsis xylanica TaxID=589385 RepID=A0A1H2SFW5_9PSEU|nr:helix-turn-helix domain-containing protein [Amycolatopsis xylanica]SDW30521.1 NACHT domain-containing protein [Amycolatopsis xylanica]